MKRCSSRGSAVNSNDAVAAALATTVVVAVVVVSTMKLTM